MSWFDASGFTSLAKSALKEAQKTIDKALDIQDDSDEEREDPSTSQQISASTCHTASNVQSDFFSSWGLSVSGENLKDKIKEQPVVTESPTKANPQTIWSSFAGSFFEKPQPDNDTIVRPPKAKSLNVISDKYDSQDDLFSKSQLIMSEGNEAICETNEFKTEERRKSSLTNALSYVSSRNSSDSVEVLSHSLKTTPDSEGASYQSASQSSSTSLKPTSESVEILPDSLMSPSSIECLGFDSYCSDKNSSTSSNSSSTDGLDKKTTPGGERTEKVETADSVSLVADDDEDTMSYNSISECTAPTVFDTDDKPSSTFQKSTRLDQRKTDKDSGHSEQVVAAKVQTGESLSNDGSRSDRNLNADCDNTNLESITEEKRDSEDILNDKLSDSSSFYNVNVSGDLASSSSSVFVNVETQTPSGTRAARDSSQRDCKVKERTSPTSSDGKSDLVKMGSDRTSGHTSADEVETATSSDIEIIPSPNGDDGHGSPRKSTLKRTTGEATSASSLDRLLGKSLATKVRGHTRASSDASDDGAAPENERLMRCLSHMAEALDARENRLLEVSRTNAELAESNALLTSQVESLVGKQEGSDIGTVTDDYTQRLSALEKKFQQAIRERDHLRKQLDNFKQDVVKKSSTGVDALLKEKDDVIAQLQEEGDKLARQELQHSNIIKKLRAKERDNERVVAGLREKVAEQTAELDRIRRSLAAKEEAEVGQIEAVYRLTTGHKKMDTELAETKSTLEDTTQKLETTTRSLEAAKREVHELQKSVAELSRSKAGSGQLQADRERAEREVEMLAHELQQLRRERAREEARWAAREEALRREAGEAREAGALEREAAPHAALLEQLAALQRAALQRDRARAAADARLAELERLAAKAEERERLAREESGALRARLAAAERGQREALARADALSARWTDATARAALVEQALHSEAAELQRALRAREAQLAEAEARLREARRLLGEERLALDTERRRSAILQEQLRERGDESPARSLASSDTCLFSKEEGACAAAWLPAGGAGGRGAAAAALLAEREVLRAHTAALTRQLQDSQNVQEQYEALLEMYGEKEEQVAELKMDLDDVTQLYKQQIDELVALRQRVGP